MSSSSIFYLASHPTPMPFRTFSSGIHSLSTLVMSTRYSADSIRFSTWAALAKAPQGPQPLHTQLWFFADPGGTPLSCRKPLSCGHSPQRDGDSVICFLLKFPSPFLSFILLSFPDCSLPVPVKMEFQLCPPLFRRQTPSKATNEHIHPSSLLPTRSSSQNHRHLVQSRATS